MMRCVQGLSCREDGTGAGAEEFQSRDVPLTERLRFGICFLCPGFLISEETCAMTLVE